MHKNTQQLGYISAWGIIIQVILLILLIIFVLIKDSGEPDVWKPAVTSYDTIDNSNGPLNEIWGFAYLIQTPLILILFACFHDYSSPSLKIFSGISLGLIISFTVFNTLSYIAQTKIDDFDILVRKNNLNLYQIRSLFQHLIDSVYMISITVFLATAELFLIPVFLKPDPAKFLIIFTLLMAGTINLISAVMFIRDSASLNLFMFLSQISFIIVVILFIKFFRQFKTHVI